MKFIVASVCAMALLLNPADAKTCTADQLAEMADVAKDYGACVSKTGTSTNLSTKEACRCYDSFAENYNAIDCDEKADVGNYATLRDQCAKGLTLLGGTSWEDGWGFLPGLSLSWS